LLRGMGASIGEHRCILQVCAEANPLGFSIASAAMMETATRRQLRWLVSDQQISAR
jgi:hypothetical protein